MIIEVYGNGALIKFFNETDVTTRLYWKWNVWSESRKTYEEYYNEQKLKTLDY
ncbi:hypothetical protein LCGC14_2829720 [marine sediment metagenome]|uniref:Uncharacterized protein n=1 Tax=marine sediment metagenome TaxID=412755 RepID=A0A0F8YEF8_9ZZZZ